MMNKIKLSAALSAATLAAVSSVANAEIFEKGSMYGGVNFALMDTTIEGLPDEASIMSIYGRLGMYFTPMLSGEIRVGSGLDSDDVSFNGEIGTVDLKSYFGAYLRAGYPINDMFNPYAVLGYTWADSSLSWASFAPADGDTVIPGEGSFNDSDVSYGVGMDVNFNDTITANLEYIILLDAHAEFGALSLGVSKSF